MSNNSTIEKKYYVTYYHFDKGEGDRIAQSSIQGIYAFHKYVLTKYNLPIPLTYSEYLEKIYKDRIKTISILHDNFLMVIDVSGERVPSIGDTTYH